MRFCLACRIPKSHAVRNHMFRYQRWKISNWFGCIFLLTAAMILTINSSGFADEHKLLPPEGNYGIQLKGTLPGPEQLSRFDLIIIDGHQNPPSLPKTLVFGYFSLGEVATSHRYLAGKLAQRNHIIIARDKDWGSEVVDPRSPVWQRFFLKTVIPDYRRRGFSGIYLDTIDSPLIVENLHPQKFPGIREALIRMLTEAHLRYPNFPIIVNRSLWILPAVARSIQGVVFEDFCREYYFRKKKYDFVPEKVVRRDNAFVRIARVLNPDLTVMTLDYGTPNDIGSMRHCFSEARRRGYHPYFTTLHIRVLNTYNLEY